MALFDTRLKREKFNGTNHDFGFSKWKILIGPCDWECCPKAKEGCERYRIHNLPQKWVPGVYELGIAVPVWGSEICKLDPDRIVVVYLGQAENVRERLQQYGRTGSHLDPDNFQQIFSQGFSIVYRLATMQNREDALRTEAQLLRTYDYAWNASHNGPRRYEDIRQTLKKIASGTRTESSKVPLTDHKLNEACNGSYKFQSRVFNFKRSRHRIIQKKTGIIRQNPKICGVALCDGSICTRWPAEKRVRCLKHKGMSTNAYTAKTIRAPKSKNTVVLEPKVYRQTKGNLYRYQSVSHYVQYPPVFESITSGNICGIILNNGSTCRREPVHGRKRCHKHRGMRFHASVY